MLQSIYMSRIHPGIADDLLAYIKGLPKEDFDRYESPFEQKWTLRDKNEVGTPLDTQLLILEGQWRKEAERAFNLPELVRDTTRHYAGVFVYDEGDQLGAHVDAGIHPITHQRKMITCLLYLGHGQSDLEFWEGTSCTSREPLVFRLGASIHPDHGMIVMFENTDNAWHAVARNQGEPRYVITVSYLSDLIDRYTNMRQRAYFVPRPNERWNKQIVEMRDRRADAEAFHTAYRT